MTTTSKVMFLIMGAILVFDAGTALAAMNACHKCVTNSSGMSKQIRREVQNIMLNHGLWLPWSYTIDGCANPIDERSNIPVVSSCYSPCYKLSINIKSKDDEEHRLVARGCRDQLIEPKLTKIYPNDANCYDLEFRTNGDDKLKESNRGHLQLIRNVSSLLCYCRGRLCNGIREDRRSENQNLSQEKPQRYLLQNVADDSIDTIPNNGHQYGHLRTPSYAHILVVEAPSSHELVTFDATFPTSPTSKSSETETFAVIDPSEVVLTTSPSNRESERIGPTTFTTQVPEFAGMVDELPKTKSTEEIEQQHFRQNTNAVTEFPNNHASDEVTMKHLPETNPQTTTTASTVVLTTIPGFKIIQRPASDEMVSIVTHSAESKPNSEYTIAYPYQETRGSHSSESAESNEKHSVSIETFSQRLAPSTTTIPGTTTRRTVDIEIVRGTILPNVGANNDSHRYVYYGEMANSAEINNHPPSKSAEIFIQTNGPLATTPNAGEFISNEVLHPPQSPTMTVGVKSPEVETSFENEKKSTVVQVSSESSESNSAEVKHSPSAAILVNETPSAGEAKKTTVEIAFSGEASSIQSSEVLKHSLATTSSTNSITAAVATATSGQGPIDSTQPMTTRSSTSKPKNSFEDHFATYAPATTKSNSKEVSTQENFFVMEESVPATTSLTRVYSKSQESDQLTTTLPNVSDYHDYSSAEARSQSETTTEGFQQPSYRHEVVDEILNELYALHAPSSLQTTISPRRSEMKSASSSTEYENKLKHSTSSSKEYSHKSTETIRRMYSDASVDVLLETTTAPQNANHAKLSVENVSEKSGSADSANLEVEVATTTQAPGTTTILKNEEAEVVDFLKSFIHVVSSLADEVTAAEQTHTVTMYTSPPEETTEQPVPATAKIMVLQLLEVPTVNLTRVKVDYKPETSTEKAVVTRELSNGNDAIRNPNVSKQLDIAANGSNSVVHAFCSIFEVLAVASLLVSMV